MNEALICVGSNDNGESNLDACRQLLTTYFEDIVYSDICVTSPIGSNYKMDFVNQLAIISTKNTQESVIEILKAIEKKLGRNPVDETNGLVIIDVDLVVWNTEILKPEDLSRSYIQDLIPSLPLQRYQRLIIA